MRLKDRDLQEISEAEARKIEIGKMEELPNDLLEELPLKPPTWLKDNDVEEINDIEAYKIEAGKKEADGLGKVIRQEAERVSKAWDASAQANRQQFKEAEEARRVVDDLSEEGERERIAQQAAQEDLRKAEQRAIERIAAIGKAERRAIEKLHADLRKAEQRDLEKLREDRIDQQLEELDRAKEVEQGPRTKPPAQIASFMDRLRGWWNRNT